MRTAKAYAAEFGLLAITFAVSILGFWDIYFASGAAPRFHHHLHLATVLIWIGLLFLQLRLFAARDLPSHRKTGLAVLAIAPLLVASSALLTVHSAKNGIASGQGDFLIVQNVMVTLELAAFILLAFLLRSNRQLHGSLMLSTAIIFGGIATFFALISFVPIFRIEGPETFYRFQTAAITGQAIWLAIGLAFFVKAPRTGWPFLLAGAFFPLTEAFKTLLEAMELIGPLTEVVAAPGLGGIFLVTLVLYAAALALVVLPRRRAARPAKA